MKKSEDINLEKYKEPCFLFKIIRVIVCFVFIFQSNFAYALNYLGGSEDGYDAGVGGTMDSVSISSSAQSFEFGDGATAISEITIEQEYGAPGAGINTEDDIRVKIPSDLDMIWDSSDTAAIVTGSASLKVSDTVSFEDSDATLVVSVSTSFSDSDYLGISGLSFKSFNSVGTSNLELEIDNAGTTVAVDSYEKTITLPASTVTFTGGSEDGYSASGKTQAWYLIQPGSWNIGATWGNAGSTEGVDYPGAGDVVTIDGGTVTLTGDQSAGGITISGGQISFGSNTLNVDGDWTYSSGTVDYSTGSVNFNAASGTKTITSGGQTFYNLTINDGGGTATYQPADTLDINGGFTLVDGVFDLATNDPVMHVATTFILSGGTFSKGAGTVTFDGDVTVNAGGQNLGEVIFANY